MLLKMCPWLRGTASLTGIRIQVMGLLQQIEDDAVNPDVDLGTLLRKCKILAARLDHKPFEEWVDRELNGYPDAGALPPYRIMHVQSRGHFFGVFGRQLKNAPIPLLNLPEDVVEAMRTVYLTEGVATYVELVGNQEKGELQSPWPPEVVAVMSDRIYADMNCIAAWRVVSASAVSGMLDTIRNRVLDFVLRLEKEAPDAGDVRTGTKPLQEDKVGKIFQNVFYGDGNIVAVGSSDFSMNAETTVRKDDIRSLRAFLERLGVTGDDLDDLEEAIRDDTPPHTPGRFGARVSEWIGTMMGKAASGIWDVAAPTASALLTKALSRYYGMGT